MISALVLVNTASGVEDKVLENLKGVEGVEEAHSLYGVYDIMIKVKAMSIDKLKDIIKLGIRKTAGVTNSLTLLLIESPIKHQDKVRDVCSIELAEKANTKNTKLNE